jgi:hypothetical protein
VKGTIVSQRPGRAAAVVLLVVAALALAGCTGSSGSAEPATPPGPDDWRRSVALEPLRVPTEMVAAADRFDLGGMVSATGDRPALVAAIGTRPAGERYLRVSLWDGNAFQHGTVDPGTPGSVQAVTAAGNSTLTVLAGQGWDAGATRPFVLTSTDRKSWTRVALPDSLAGYRPVAATADDDRVVVLAQEVRGAAAVIDVDRTGTSQVHPLPGIPDGQERDLTSIALAGGTVVVTGVQGADLVGAPQVIRSTDGGRTWAEPGAIADGAEATINGVTVVGGGFLATGSKPATGEGETGKRATAWFSTDAVTWTAETLPEADGFRWADNSSKAGVPTAAGDYVLTVASSTSSLSSRLLQRQPSGQWIDLGATDAVAQAADADGRVVPIVAPGDNQPPGASFIGIEGVTGSTVGRLRSGVWDTVIATSANQRLPFFQSTRSGAADRWRATIRQRHLESVSGGWRMWWEPTEVGLSGDALVAVPWDPPQVAGSGNVHRSSSDGAEVALASGFTEDRTAVTVSAWFRAGPGQPWILGTGFGAQTTEQITTVGHLGGRWLAGGLRAVDGPRDQQAMIWTSADGLSWSRADGDFTQDDRESSIDDVCAAPDGTPVAVGSITNPDGTTIGALWIEQAGRWQRADQTAESGPDEGFLTCSTAGGALVIDGSAGDQDRRWTWSQGSSFAPIEPPPVGGDTSGSATEGGGPSAEPSDSPTERDRTQLRGVQEAAGGYVASGRIDAAAYVGPVLWLSRDGESWRWVPIPVTRPDAWVVVVVVDDDVVMVSSSDTESQAWRVRDVAAVIAAIPTAT